MTNENINELLEDGLQRVSEAAQFLSISRASVYRLINEGILPTVKIGCSIRLPVRAVRDLAATNLSGVTSEDIDETK